MLKPNWFLSPEETGGAGAADAGSTTAQNEGATNDATTAPADTAEDGSSAGTIKTDKDQNGTEAGGKNKGSNFVPYDRFHEVNTKYREETAVRAKLEAELSFLKEKIAADRQSRESPEQMDPELKRTIDYYKPLLVGKDMEKTNQRIEKLENELKARDENQKLEKAIGELEAKYPAIKDAPYARNMLTNEYILNPKSNLEDMANQINSFFVDRDKRVIHEYVTGKQGASQHKGANPPGSGPANKPTPLPKNASVTDVFKFARDKAVARLENADK